jgi:glycogenin glucosyltransferase
MKYAFVTVLSTNNYYKGVIGLFESIKMTNTKYNNFVVIINENIDKNIINEFDRRGYKIVVKPNIEVSPLVKNDNYAYWNNTFDKFNVFDLVDYDKIVYLDSDMYVQNNIDELFDYPHMSAVIAGHEYIPDWDEINSGLMVIEPKIGIKEELIKIVQEHDFGKEIGDQNVIEYFYDWKNLHLEISETYNMFACYSDQYVNNFNYKKEDIKIIHFVGPVKPWMLTDIESHINDLKAKDHQVELYFFDKYIKILSKIKDIEY